MAKYRRGLSAKERKRVASRRGRGETMSRATFNKIKRAAAARGARDPEAVAGEAYWRAAAAKARKRRKK